MINITEVLWWAQSEPELNLHEITIVLSLFPLCRCCAAVPEAASLSSPECVWTGRLGPGQHHRWVAVGVNVISFRIKYSQHQDMSSICVCLLSRWRTTVQRLCDQPGCGQASPLFHQSLHPHHLPPQCHLGHGQPVPPQGPSTTYGDDPGGVYERMSVFTAHSFIQCIRVIWKVAYLWPIASFSLPIYSLT